MPARPDPNAQTCQWSCQPKTATRTTAVGAEYVDTGTSKAEAGYSPKGNAILPEGMSNTKQYVDHNRSDFIYRSSF
jgi:hypothetical protein